MTTPAALVGAVQRFGLFSATAVVARYTEIVDGAIASDAFAPVDTGRAARSVLGLVDAAAALLRADPSPRAPLLLPPVSPGAGSEVSLWVHNGTASPVPVPELHATALASSSGANIPADLVPARADVLSPGTALEVRLCVRVPTGQPAGTYHGLVLASAAPDEPLAVRLEVR